MDITNSLLLISAKYKKLLNQVLIILSLYITISRVLYILYIVHRFPEEQCISFMYSSLGFSNFQKLQHQCLGLRLKDLKVFLIFKKPV
jgi:hypothetical protein